ncbi:hypothetical protein PHET_02306 [Paragonimus heterotremus]|uniref:Midasin n=1 Tax=Paragonimus heterotremus TaxID=100268 RepID=A0A8J4X1T8_9TREM|nr:hypothetical protein PHET_02306 [Paragonimus heterotremus]
MGKRRSKRNHQETSCVSIKVKKTKKNSSDGSVIVTNSGTFTESGKCECEELSNRNVMNKKEKIVLSSLSECFSQATMAVKRFESILVAGPVGCGKSTFIEQLSETFGAQVCHVQVSEQMDAKNLLGAYSCTEIPGQFIWRPGPLLNAMAEGLWLVLEDVDRGSADLQVLLTPLLRSSRSLSNPVLNTTLLNPVTGTPVCRHPDFRILMTRRLVKSHSGDLHLEYDNVYADMIERQSCLIMLPAMHDDSLRLLIPKLFPGIQTLVDRMIMNIYHHVCYESAAASVEVTSRSRVISTRDLLKFCTRIAPLSEETRQSDVLLLHAVDCFLACLSDTSRLLRLATLIAGELNLTPEKVTHILYRRRIELSVNPDEGAVYLGRSSLPCHRTAEWETRLASGVTSSGTTDGTSWPFASTHLACTLLERLAEGISNHEPLLLVGETGTGKTSAVQRLAQLCGRRLHVINLNQQSDSIDLLGGFKPVDMRTLIRPLREKFETLFCRTFRMETNATFLGHINTCFNDGRWRELFTLMQHPSRLAVTRPETSARSDWFTFLQQLDSLQRRLEAVTKANQPSLGFAFIEGALVRALQDGDWVLLDEINLAPAEMFDSLSGLLDSERGSLTLVERGDKEPLKRSSDFHLFAAMNPSTDVGKRELPVGLRNRFTEIYVPELDPGLDDTDVDPIRAVNREDLATLIRSYLRALNPSPVQITSLVRLYAALRRAALEGLVDGVGQRPHFSLRTLCRALIEAGRGYHGSTVRSLYEGLIFSFGSQISRSSRPVLDLLIRRYLCLSFGSQNRKLDLNTLNQLIASPLPKPIVKHDVDVKNQADYQHVEGYWIPRGPREPCQPTADTLVDGNYILTPSVRANLRDLARVVAAGGSLPVLLQGETSVGKTSLITYLASRIGQICYRINNHEHTDQQTYLGTYTVASATAQATGKLVAENDSNIPPPPLVFKDGPLVQAMRLGHWIILDELNLAPTDILEALNRVLDDNRTVFIPDTQEVVRAHPQFRLFATQNPPGLYAGRKLARCNSNLFQGKDSFITLRDLFRWAERYRLATCVTPSEKACTFFDWDTYLAEQGYLLLAGRVRNSSEAKLVAEAIEAVFKRPISESRLFDFTSETSPACLEFLQPFLSTQNPGSERPIGFEHIVWTRDMRRMLVLIGNALKYHEPVLLIGDTSCGKTTVCQLFAAIKHQSLHCVNCHQYTEAADFLGGLRPIRRSQSESNSESAQDGRLFEWVDGPLVTAMMRGEMFLLDEISLADDAVLECLNSLLEPERRLHLSERFEGTGDGTLTAVESNELTAHVDFRLVATMNPGGDYGKKELSPALRNRFTEIWCPTPLLSAVGTRSESSHLSQYQFSSDLFDIVEHNLLLHLPFLRESCSLMAKQLVHAMVDFVVRIAEMQLHNQCSGLIGRRAPPTIRDLIAWIRFMQSVTTSTTGLQFPTSLTNTNSCRPNCIARLDVLSACLHGAALIFLDAVDQNTSSIDNQGIDDPVADANVYLWKRLRTIASEHHLPTNALDFALHYAHNSSDIVTQGEPVCEQFGLVDDGLWFGADPFYLRTGPRLSNSPDSTAQPFSFSAPTPAMNLRRLLRAMQLPQRALLLEGSPGVGKTTLVLALARACGHEVVRINLSEATEASDLIGCDLPVEGAGAGVFVWRDGPLLQGLRRGHWIVLDEMNLASQSVLECLNACLDHRGEIYIPELNTSFKVNPESTRLFACQNPVREGGGRKGLPKSFLNRFTQVYLQPLSTTDQSFILHQLYPALTPTVIRLMVRFNETLNHRVNVTHEFATGGGPWEFNLRDLMRWSEMILKHQSTEGISPGLYVHFIYVDRMRSVEDKQKVADLWREVCSESQTPELMVYYKALGCMRLINRRQLRVGLAGFDRISSLDADSVPNYLILDQHRGTAESLLKVLEMGWMAILVGPPGSGKRTLVNICSTLVGQPMATMCLSPTADTVELLGTLEQREAGGLFSWVDSPLVTGMRNGHWVVIENAHFCSPSVLDRLNSVLESDGELMLGERGLDSENRLIRLRPHTAFRLILIVDEAVFGASPSVPNGVSRAMRNRGVEITTLSEVTSSELDFTRLLVSRGTPLPYIHALTKFHSIYTSLCADLSSGATHRLNLLSESMFTDLRPGCCKRPPVGMLLSAGLVMNQLLDTSSDTGLFMLTLRSLFPDEDDVNDEQTVSISYNPNCPQTRWCWILHRTLNFVYTMRQPNHQAARLTNRLIHRFIKDIQENRPELRQSLEQPECADPAAIVLHHLSELVQCGTADGYRRYHARIVCMAARSCSTDQFLCRRVFLEQANLEDLIYLPDQLTEAMQHVDQTVVDNLNWPSIGASDGWTDWPDLRWFPGWRYLASEDSRLPVHKWDIHFRSLLIDELVQFVASSCISSNVVPEKLNEIGQLSVIQAVCQLRQGHMSDALLNDFPGLSTVLDPWLDFVRSFMFVKAEESTQADWLNCCRAISLVWTWFSHFALKPLCVEAIDWSDRLTYHTERAQMCGPDERRVRPPCFEIMRPHFSLTIQPRFYSLFSIEGSLIVPNWISFGKKLGDILVTLRTDCSSNDMDEEEDVLDEERTELLCTSTQFSNERGPVTDFSIKTPQVRNMCLWPLAMLSVLHLDRCVGPHDPAVGSIRARVRIFLLGLTRPRILTVLSMLQPSFMSSHAQQRAFQRCLTETAVDRWIQDVCCQIDLFATGRLLPAFAVDQLERPTLHGEWRSLGQAIYALTWPTLSRYSEGTCSTDQPLIGWLHSRVVFGYAHRLLLLCSTWTPKEEVTSSPSSDQNQQPADVTDLFRQSAALLHTIHSVLVSFIHPERIQSNASDRPYDMDDFTQWILLSFTPIIGEAKLAFCVSREWMELLQLIEGFIACLIQLSHQPNSASLLAVGWITFGCVHVRSVCPHGPLDPWLVEQLELEASSSEYSQLRRRLSAYVTGFTDKLLLAPRKSDELYPVINSSICTTRWLEVVSDLCEWLTEPERFNTFADIVEPFLNGILSILRGLRIWTHNVSSARECELSTVVELVELLSTGLLTNKRVTERKISSSCPSSALSLATQLTSVTWRRILNQSVSRDVLSDSTQANRNAEFRVEFRLFSLILDLIWLHRLEACDSYTYPNNIKYIGRLLAFLNRPLAWRWQRAEAERKKAAAERAALFIEATGKKQRLQDELQQLPKRPKQRSADDNSDLVDPDLMEEVEWRLRFPETASLQAVVELNTDRRSFGLSKEEQIQQTVDRMHAVDAWLAEALQRTDQTWVPDDCELSYWVERTMGLLLTDVNCTDLGQSTTEWRWHTLLGGYSLAGWLACRRDSLSLDPAMDVSSLPVHIAITAYLSQADLRARVRLHNRTQPFHYVLDVYRDPIPLDAALQLQTVLERLDSRVRQLLHDWPGQPSLIRLLTLRRRLEGFRVSDPLIKFLTGLEMVWQEILEWEKNAAKHVSLMEHCKAVCDLLIEWRKMELNLFTRTDKDGIVHVTKWGDYAHFWSVKCNVDRCKKNIHKQVRNWEAVLRRPVRPLFEAAIAVPRLESLSSLVAPDVPLLPTSLISNSKDRWPSVGDLQWLCAEQPQGHSPPNLLRRLPTLLKRFHRHLERLQTGAPVAKWTQCLLTGMRTWIQLVSELENSTRHLESTCPPAHRLRQLHAAGTKSATRNPEPNDLDDVRKWHQQFTALQQQKRLVLAQWLKVASARSQPCGYVSREMNQFETSLELNDSRLSDFEKSPVEAEEEEEEDSAEIISFDGDALPQLGLSYRRGQRHTQTGSMTEFLVHIQGNPWMQVSSHVLQTVQEGPGSIAESSAEKVFDHNTRHLAVTTCQRLARLIALRAGLPRTPGPPDATPETVSAIIGELGGPANLARLVGLADDLLNQCTTAMGVCSHVDSMAKEFSQRIDACYASLYDILVATDGVDKLERDEIQAPVCIPFGSDKTVLHRIKASIHTVGQLVQDIVHLSSTFWKACSQQSLAHPSKNLTDLCEVFGSETWDSMIQTHLSSSVDAFGPLCMRMERHVTQLDTVAADIRNSVSSMLSSHTFLLTPCWIQWYSQLDTSVNNFLTVIDEMMAECARSDFRFTVLDQQLSCVSSRIRAELGLISCNLSSAQQTYTVDLPSISSHGDDTQYEVLANNLIKSVLSTMETLYRADRQINMTEKDTNEKSQIELLNQYAQTTCRACEINLKHVSKYLSRLCLQLEQSDPSIFSVRLRLLRSVFPLIDALMQSVQLRSVQFWQLLDSWARLAECFLRVTGRLLTDGFCRPAGLDRSASGTDCCTPTDNQTGQTQEASGGGTSLTAEGVDTTGAKDVSNELECQEQIEGLMNDSKQDSEQTNQDQERRGGESDGIEMPDDNFQGEFEDSDLIQDEKMDESLDEASGDELDDRMGGTGGQSDGLSKEMWASEDEDDRVDHTENGKSSANQEEESGGVEERDADKNDCSTGDDSELQNRDKPKRIDETEDTAKKNPDELPSEFQEPSSDKRLRSKKSSQDTMTVAGDEGHTDSPDDDLVPEPKSDVDADDSSMKGDAILAELESRRLEEENTREPEDMPSDLLDQSVDDTNDNDDVTDVRDESTPEEDVHADKLLSDNQLDELMENEQEGKDTVESFHYQPAAGDLTTKSEVPNELDCSQSHSDAWESSDHTNNAPMDTSEQQAGYQRTSSSQYGNEGVTPDQFKTPENVGANTQTRPKRRAQCGPRPTSDNRTQDSSADRPIRGAEVMDTDESTKPQKATDQDSSGETNHHLYQHVTPEDADMDGDEKSPESHVVDSANKRQQECQGRPLSPNSPDTDVGRESEDANDEVDAIPTDVTDPTQPLNLLPSQKSCVDPVSKGNTGSDSATLPDAELDLIATLGAQRPPDSFICTRPEAVVQIAPPRSVEQLLMDTSMPDNQYAITPVSSDTAREALSEWLACTQRSVDLARQLCESLRLVLEPTKAARMRGDYRTGKRINMRKIIPYLASQFRKDKIWLRRSQPSQREYRILIAVDDSSSMSDNLCRQMTFDALATVVTALNLLEVGRIGICSFGESVRVLHGLQDTWVSNAGPNVLARFTFQQSRTSLVQLLHSAIKMVMHTCSGSTSSGTVPSQLLLILSDGVFSEDPQEPNVQAAVRLARDARLFPVCVILDDVRKKHSIFDLRRYTSAGKLTPYMDTFPLPFYVVLRDVTALPNLLSDALRQWFELEASFGR